MTMWSVARAWTRRICSFLFSRQQSDRFAATDLQYFFCLFTPSGKNSMGSCIAAAKALIKMGPNLHMTPPPETSTRGTFWIAVISGLIGAAIGAGGVYFSQEQATIAENQYYMQLDQLRLSEFASGESLEKRLESMRDFEKIENEGYRRSFNDSLKVSIDLLETEIAEIKKAASKNAEETARLEAEATAKAEAKRQFEQAVRTNPLIFDSCDSKSSSGTWRRSGLICP